MISTTAAFMDNVRVSAANNPGCFAAYHPRLSLRANLGFAGAPCANAAAALSPGLEGKSKGHAGKYAATCEPPLAIYPLTCAHLLVASSAFVLLTLADPTRSIVLPYHLQALSSSCRGFGSD